MQRTDNPLKPSLKAVLAESHVGAVAIGVLLVWALESGSQVLWRTILKLAAFLVHVTAVAINGWPYMQSQLSVAEGVYVFEVTWYLISFLICFTSAQLLSRWVFGKSPFVSLRQYLDRIKRRQNA
jgi:hypothetical protein